MKVLEDAVSIARKYAYSVAIDGFCKHFTSQPSRPNQISKDKHNYGVGQMQTADRRLQTRNKIK